MSAITRLFGAPALSRLALLGACCAFSAAALAESYLGLNFGMSKKQVEALYGTLQPSATSSYRNAYSLPLNTPLTGLPKAFESRKASEINVYFDQAGKLWSIYVQTENAPSQSMLAEHRQIIAAYQQQHPVQENVAVDPAVPLISLRDCHYLQGISQGELQREFGKQKVQAFQKRLKTLNADERQSWGSLCGNLNYIRTLLGEPGKVQTIFSVAIPDSGIPREEEFFRQFAALLDGQPLQSSTEFIIAQTTPKAPTLDAMRDLYRKPAE
ncbi:hypothetical protein [Chitinilyticum piscinae]|uniref:DUF4412 domain-containing protein n=1 Tax=Chitinilyticum piscinae TaxID=2866724 RepID=A0A8J7FHE9_9NEIS|nr:hypothetical protein [Chitinilyticum piscinae]MBE9609265.1 hypothetical protein [Chitinilyticum piscinae]